MEKIPFNRTSFSGKEIDYLTEAIRSGSLSGNGPFTKKCQQWLKSRFKAAGVFLTHSCTHALEMSALLLDFKPGDEVIMPSFTFVSTANAVCLRGATPVFVDVRADTLNIDENLISDAVTTRTKAICPVHYAGVSCAMDTISEIAKVKRLEIFEDGAQALGSTYKGEPLGQWSDLFSLSFHNTKNIVSGEGGALVIRNSRWLERAEILWEKGTNRAKFLLGEVDKYSWVDIGSSFLPSELEAAFLLAQLEKEQEINRERIETWNSYHDAFEAAEKRELLKRPIVPDDCTHNGHIYYVLVPTEEIRNRVLMDLKEDGIQCTAHYVPLHSSQMGRKVGRSVGSMQNTDSLSSRLIRLPMSLGMKAKVPMIVDRFLEVLKRRS